LLEDLPPFFLETDPEDELKDFFPLALVKVSGALTVPVYGDEKPGLLEGLNPNGVEGVWVAVVLGVKEKVGMDEDIDGVDMGVGAGDNRLCPSVGAGVDGKGVVAVGEKSPLGVDGVDADGVKDG